MRAFLEGDLDRAPYSCNEIQNRRGSRRHYCLRDQSPTLIQYRHRNRVPVDIQPDISHTIHLGVPFFRFGCLLLTATAAYSKGAPFYTAWPRVGVVPALGLSVLDEKYGGWPIQPSFG